MVAHLFTPDSTTHLAQLAEVERLAWASDGQHISAATAKIAARIEVFPQGVTLATIDGTEAGSQYAFQLSWDGNPNSLTSWDEMTAEGWYNRVHYSQGNTGFLVGVGVVPCFRGSRVAHNLRWNGRFKLSELLIARTLDMLFDHGVHRVIGNARVPAYHQRPDLSIDAFCTFRRPDGKLFDPVLRFHERMGARILKPVEYSMEDDESLNAGCWVIYERRFPG